MCLTSVFYVCRATKENIYYVTNKVCTVTVLILPLAGCFSILSCVRYLSFLLYVEVVKEKCVAVYRKVEDCS